MANFSIVDKMYSGRELDWKKLTIFEKESIYFIINRCMNMLKPMQAAELSRNKISEIGVVEYWQTILSKNYSRTPGCFYQVNPKKKKEEKLKKTKQFVPNKETIEYYCDIYNLDSESYKELEIRFKDDLYLELEEIYRERKKYV